MEGRLHLEYNLHGVTFNSLRSTPLRTSEIRTFLGLRHLETYDIYSFLEGCDESAFLIKSALIAPPKNIIKIEFHFRLEGATPISRVSLVESKPLGSLVVSCDTCNGGCIHAAAAVELLSVSQRKIQHFTDFDEALDDLRVAIVELQKQQRENTDLARKPYPVPQDLSFVGVSIIADSKLLNPQFFKHKIENCRKDEFDPTKYRTKKYNPDDWPKYFQAPNVTSAPRPDSYERETWLSAMRIADIFRFHFSDGRYIQSSQLAFHPLAELIPNDLQLMTADKADSHLDMGEWKELTAFGAQSWWNPNIIQTQRLIQGLLLRVIENTNSKHVAFFIEDASNLGHFARITTIVKNTKEVFKWTVDHQTTPYQFTMALMPRGSFTQLLNAGDFLFAPKQKALLFTKSSDLLAEARMALQDYGHSTINSATDEHPLGSVSIFNAGILELGVQGLRASGYEVEIKNGTHEFSESQYTSQINLTPQGLIEISHEFELKEQAGSEPIVLKGISKDFANLLFVANGGIPTLHGYEAKVLASKTAPKRERDMKLLKHMGVFQYLLFELLSLTLEGSLSDGQKPKKSSQVWSLLEPKILMIFLNSTAESKTERFKSSGEAYFSARVLGYFKSFIDWFQRVTTAKSTAYTKHGELVFHKLHQRELVLFYILLKAKLSVTDPSQFFKARTEILKDILATPLTEINYCLLDAAPNLRRDDGELIDRKCFLAPGTDALLTLQPLTDRGFEFTIDHQPLMRLLDGEFDIRLMMEESSQPSGTTSQSLDWFSLHPKIFLKGKEINPSSSPNLLSNGIIEHDGKLYLVPRKQIPTLSRLETFWRKIQNVGTKEASFGSAEKRVSVPRSKVLEILALRASGVAIKGSGEWDKVCAFYDSLGSPRHNIKLPKSIQAELKPYQKEGVRWLLDLHSLRLGALLGDDMGLGKTLQTLAFLEVLRSKKELGATLIVVPSALLYNWQTEIEKFVPHLPYTLLTGKQKILNVKSFHDRQPHVYITTYGLLNEHEQIFTSVSWHMLIFDEAQNLKNITAKRTSAARKLKAHFKICLTGTPMENHLGEFFSLMDLTVPGCLDDHETFTKLFVTPSEVAPDDIRYLKLKTKPLVLRRLKRDILTQLPDKTETTVIVPFEAKQMKIYRDVALAFNEKIQTEIQQNGEGKMQLQMLTALLRLRQICSDPSALPNIVYNKTPPKLEALVDAVKEIVESGESILVFTQFLSTLDKTQRLLEQEGVKVFTLHGGHSAVKKRNILAEFEQFPEAAVLIMTLKTGGVGLNLTKASYVFHLEPWWNPAAENQATDRAHRMGQTKPVQVYKYIMHESVEEKIELLKKRKAAQFESLFSDTEIATADGTKTSKTNHLSKEDFALLLS